MLLEVAGSFNVSFNPIKLEKAVYGAQSSKYIDFLAPGMMVLITFGHTIGITAVAFVREKLDGTLDRIYAAGVTSGTMIAAHFVTHTSIILIQTLILLLMAVFAFEVTLVGNVIYVAIVVVLLGLAGMSFGLLISSSAPTETDAIQLSIASYFPALLLSGVLWPIEAIPKWISWLSYALPTTWAAAAMRSIMIRGWGIQFQQIWIAMLVIALWSALLVVLATFSLKTRERPLFSKWRKS